MRYSTRPELFQHQNGIASFETFQAEGNTIVITSFRQYEPKNLFFFNSPGYYPRPQLFHEIGQGIIEAEKDKPTDVYILDRIDGSVRVILSQKEFLERFTSANAYLIAKTSAMQGNVNDKTRFDECMEVVLAFNGLYDFIEKEMAGAVFGFQTRQEAVDAIVELGTKILELIRQR